MSYRILHYPTGPAILIVTVSTVTQQLTTLVYRDFQTERLFRVQRWSLFTGAYWVFHQDASFLEEQYLYTRGPGPRWWYAGVGPQKPWVFWETELEDGWMQPLTREL